MKKGRKGERKGGKGEGEVRGRKWDRAGGKEGERNRIWEIHQRREIPRSLLEDSMSSCQGPAYVGLSCDNQPGKYPR